MTRDVVRLKAFMETKPDLAANRYDEAAVIRLSAIMCLREEAKAQGCTLVESTVDIHENLDVSLEDFMRNRDVKRWIATAQGIRFP